jgi:hypothetical protein
LRSRLVDIDCFEDRFTVNDCFVNTEPVAAMGAIASVIDDDAARWINGASKDIMDVQNEVEDFVGQAFPWNCPTKDTISENEWSYCAQCNPWQCQWLSYTNNGKTAQYRNPWIVAYV